MKKWIKLAVVLVCVCAFYIFIVQPKIDTYKEEKRIEEQNQIDARSETLWRYNQWLFIDGDFDVKPERVDKENLAFDYNEATLALCYYQYYGGSALIVEYDTLLEEYEHFCKGEDRGYNTLEHYSSFMHESHYRKPVIIDEENFASYNTFYNTGKYFVCYNTFYNAFMYSMGITDSDISGLTEEEIKAKCDEIFDNVEELYLYGVKLDLESAFFPFEEAYEFLGTMYADEDIAVAEDGKGHLELNNGSIKLELTKKEWVLHENEDIWVITQIEFVDGATESMFGTTVGSEKISPEYYESITESYGILVESVSSKKTILSKDDVFIVTFEYDDDEICTSMSIEAIIETE